MGDPTVGEISDHWEFTTLGEVCDRGGRNVQTGPLGSWNTIKNEDDSTLLGYQLEKVVRGYRPVQSIVAGKFNRHRSLRSKHNFNISQGFALQTLDRLLLNDASLTQHNHLVAQLLDFTQRMAGKQYGSAILNDVFQFGEDFFSN